MWHNLSSKELKLKRDFIDSHNRQVQGRGDFDMVGFQSSYFVVRNLCLRISVSLKFSCLNYTDRPLSGQRGCWLAWLYILSVLWLYLKGTIFCYSSCIKKKKKIPGRFWLSGNLPSMNQLLRAGRQGILIGLAQVLSADGAGGELDQLSLNKGVGFLGEGGVDTRG